MFTPGLPSLACLAVPLLGLWLVQRGLRVSRLFATLAALMGAIALALFAAEALLSPASLQAWPLASFVSFAGEAGTPRISVRMSPAFIALNASLLASCAAIFWLQEQGRAAYYGQFTGWLAAPMASFASATEAMGYSLTYFMGFYDWAFARPADKAMIIATAIGFTLTAVALAGFAMQLVASLLRALARQRNA